MGNKYVKFVTSSKWAKNGKLGMEARRIGIQDGTVNALKCCVGYVSHVNLLKYGDDYYRNKIGEVKTIVNKKTKSDFSTPERRFMYRNYGAASINFL